VDVGGVKVGLLQGGSQCGIALNPLSMTLSPAAQQASIGISVSPADCTWQASGAATWLQATGAAASGTGNGSFAFTTLPNPTNTRTATLDVCANSYCTAALINQLGFGHSPSEMPSISSVVNAASGQLGISGNGFVTILGNNFSTTSDTWDGKAAGGQLPTVLAGTQVTIGFWPCYISFISPAQINCLMYPYYPPLQSAPVEVLTASGGSMAQTQLSDTAPAFFTLSIGGATYAIGTIGNSYTLIAPENSISGLDSRPAKAGDILQLYVNGLGVTSPDVPAGQVPSIPYPVSNLGDVLVMINGQLAQVLFAGVTSPGLYQLNVVVPDGLPLGRQLIRVKRGSQLSPDGIYLSCQ